MVTHEIFLCANIPTLDDSGGSLHGILGNFCTVFWGILRGILGILRGISEKSECDFG